jgi:uncharacterized protein YbjT (DUF2867 family)
MDILVTGGTGTLGRATVPLLRAAGHRVRVLSRRTGPGLSTGDLERRHGLTQALDGIHTVVHLATSGGARDIRAAANLTKAAVEAGVQHLISMSIVGVDRVPLPYYQAKLETERQLQASGLGLTILRATQFHDLVVHILRSQRPSPLLFVPDIPIQPVDTTVVGARLVALVDQQPAGRVRDLGGPSVERFTDLATQWQAHIGRRRRIVPVRLPGRTFAAYGDGGHLARDGAAEGTPSFADFLGAGAR